MDSAQFPWRPLGALLVEKGLLTGAELEQALAEQRRTGRVLGEILVGSGYVSGLALARRWPISTASSFAPRAVTGRGGRQASLPRPA